MGKDFNYSKAIAELGEIVAKVEDPATSLDDISKHLARAKELVKRCRLYLRTVQEELDKIGNDGDEGTE
jgi:exodeoxyribonuclease VII small subunit